VKTVIIIIESQRYEYSGSIRLVLSGRTGAAIAALEVRLKVERNSCENLFMFCIIVNVIRLFVVQSSNFAAR
jgi:hypothetical protein